jgi:soluble lytic murein transglycosylase-like protein
LGRPDEADPLLDNRGDIRDLTSDPFAARTLIRRLSDPLPNKGGATAAGQGRTDNRPRWRPGEPTPPISRATRGRLAISPTGVDAGAMIAPRLSALITALAPLAGGAIDPLAAHAQAPAAVRENLNPDQPGLQVWERGGDGALMMSASVAPEAAPTAPVSATPACPHAPALAQAASQRGVPVALVLAVVDAESRCRHAGVVSPKGAIGLMQLMPATAARFGAADPWDVAQNIAAGTRYLAWLQDRFGGDQTLMIAAYNAGEGAVDRHGGVPPYAETRAYVRRVLARMPSFAVGAAPDAVMAAPAPNVAVPEDTPPSPILIDVNDGAEVRPQPAPGAPNTPD